MAELIRGTQRDLDSKVSTRAIPAPRPAASSAQAPVTAEAVSFVGASPAPLGTAQVLTLQRMAGNAAVGRLLSADVRQSKGEPLTPAVRSDMERRLDHDFGDVRVHHGSQAAQAADAIGAEAFTIGTDVTFAEGRWSPDTTSGRQRLAHELVHVSQQHAGPVSGRAVGGGLAISDPGDEYEREAAQLASRASASSEIEPAAAKRGRASTVPAGRATKAAVVAQRQENAAAVADKPPQPAAAPVPTDVQALFDDAMAQSNARQYERALIAWERVRRHPALPAQARRDVLYNIGAINLRLSRFDEAIPAFEEYLTFEGADVADGRRWLAQARRSAGILDIAEGGTQSSAAGGKGAEKAAGSAPPELQALYNDALSLQRQGQYERAITAWERVRRHPALPAQAKRDLLYTLGGIKLRLSRFADAIPLFTEYLTFEGADVKDGQAKLKKAQKGAGITVTADTGAQPPGAADKPPQQASTPVPAERVKDMFYAALNLVQVGRYEAAIIAFEQVLQLPGLEAKVIASATFNIGSAKVSLSRFAEAIPYFEKYLTLEGADVKDGQLWLAKAQRGAGAPVTAAEAPADKEGEPAKESQPDAAQPPAAAQHPAAAPLPVERARELSDKAWQLYQEGRFRQAIIAFERVRQTPGLPVGFYRSSVFNIGQANLRLSRFATAIVYFELYLSLEGADVELGTRRLAEAQRGAGIPVSAEAPDKEGQPDAAQPPTAPAVPLDRVRKLFDNAMQQHEKGRYRQAIIAFERIRQMRGLPTSFYTHALFNIGQANLRLSRFATAIIYFEQYVRAEGADVEVGRRRLAEAQRGAGTPVTTAAE